MTESTTAATKATRPSKPAASPFGMPDYSFPKFEMPKFDLSGIKMPEPFREMAEKQAEQSRAACAKARAASEEAVDLLENNYEAVVKRATDYNRKLIEISRTNTRAAFDYVQQLLGVKSPSELIELSTAQMRRQFESASAQNRELCALAQEMASEAADTIKTNVSRTLNKAT